jgi:anti-sigma factor RsiW
MTEASNAMRCHEVHDLLMEFLDGGLAAGPAAEVQEHLAGCARCAAARDELRAALALVHADVVPEPPPGTWDRFALDVWEKIRRAEEAEAAGRGAVAEPPPRQPRSALPGPGLWERVFGRLSFAPFPPLAAATAVAVLLAIGVIRMQKAPERAFDPGRDLALAQDLEVLRAVDRPEDLDVIERLPDLLALVRRGA